jgi:hypothetical protein
MYVREISWAKLDWIHLVQDKDKLRAFVNTIVKRRVP